MPVADGFVAWTKSRLNSMYDSELWTLQLSWCNLESNLDVVQLHVKKCLMSHFAVAV